MAASALWPSGGQRFEELLLGGADQLVPGLLLGLLVGGGHRLGAEFADAGLQGGCLGRGLGQGPGLLGGVFGQFDDRLDHRAHVLVAEVDGAEHDIFGQLLGLALDHQHAFGGAGDDEVELAGGELVTRRVEDISAFGKADAGGGDRAEERDAGEGQRGRAADQRDDVRIVLHVVAEHGGDDLNFVAEALGE